MEQKLLRLKDRLSDLSRRNRSLRLLRISSKWSFDLTQLDQDEETSHAPKILESVISGRNKIRLTSVATDQKQQACEQSLTYLYRTMKAIEEETGLYDLYLGYPFLTGNLRDGSFIQAPLFLYPVRLVRHQRNDFHIELFPDAEPHLNRTLFLALKKFHQSTIDESLFEDLEQLKKMDQTPLSSWADWLHQNHIEVTYTEENIQPLKHYKRDTIPQDAPLTLKPFAILGSFPQGNSALISDYDELMNYVKDQELPLIQELITFNEESQHDPMPDSDLEWVKRSTVQEEEQFYLLPSDYSQELILQMTQSINGLVVHGPPGTGKSQVIVNLITDALAKGKKILVVCQKRAALDVVVQRLDSLGLSPYVALIHDEKQDRKALYRQVNHQIPDTTLPIQELESSFQHLCKRIEDREQKLDRIYQGLHERQSFGFSAFELYGRAKKRDDVVQTISISDLASSIHRDHLDDLLATISLYGSYYQRFGKDGYVLKRRKSLANLELKDQTMIIEQLELALQKAKQAVEQLNQLDHEKITPAYLWLVSDRLAKVYDDLDPSEKKTLQKLRLWWWTSFTGKGIIEELLHGQKFKGTSSSEWPMIKESLRTMYEIAKLTSKLDQHLQFLARILDDTYFNQIRKELSEGKVPDRAILQIREAIAHDFDDLRSMDRCYLEASPQVQKMIQRLQEKEIPCSSQVSEYWVEIVRQSFYTYWIDEIERKHPVLSKVSTDEFEQIRYDFGKLLADKRTLALQVLENRILKNINHSRQTNVKAFRELRHQTGKQRQIWPVRRLVKSYAEKGLLEVLPVWLASPETVSSIFPLSPGLFDLVIFDEASQCTVESGLPAVFRGKQVVIAGDEKQLPPFEQFRVSLYDEDEEDEDFEMEESRSLLNLAKRTYPVRMLQYHYRSKSEELIHFSNHAFYNGLMQVAPNVFSDSSIPAIQWMKVDGRWVNQCNEREAIAVVNLLQQQLEQKPHQTVGIITFNSKQQDVIWQMIEQKAKDDPHFSAIYEETMKREMDQRIFVKNIENVQGDERDVIIFSVGYAPNEQGRIYNRFGLLNKQGGENRLNVAITRAKEEIYVVASIEPAELNVAGSKHDGPKLFRHYLEYVKAVSEGNKNQVSSVLERINPQMETKKQTNRDQFDSPFEVEVCEALREIGYQVDTQIGVSGYRIDLGIVHPKEPTHYILGIECDGSSYHSSPFAKERDLYRQEFLETRGWKIQRIWSRNWWRNPSTEIERIDRIIKEMLLKEEHMEKVKIFNQ
ncbi:AAA domain-containing protein [Hazenella coriacea]|nr:AAA domain-containing protein [Hazenella coriacea]